MAITLAVGTQVAIASAYGASKTMSAISNATAAVATLEASHGVIVGDYVEMFRDIALVGRLPNLFAYVIVVALSYAVFLGGYKFFMRYKSVIVDVI